MSERWAGWFDTWLSRWIVEPRFVSRRHPAELAAKLRATRCALPTLSEADWFAPQPALEPRNVTQGHRCGQPIELVTWEAPRIPVDRKLGVELATQGGCVSLFSSAPSSGAGRRPLWILIHGWLGGTIARDLRDWPFETLLDDYDIAHVVLPGHGPRRAPAGLGWPSFPTRNPFANALGLAVATAELRQLVAWLKDRGYSRLGIAGTSIGANVAALYASVIADVERMLLDRPLVRMSEPLRRVAERYGGQYQSLLVELEAVYAPVDPLQRSLVLPNDRVAVLLGRADAIAGASAGLALAEHWGALPHWFDGGHVFAAGRRETLLPLFRVL